MLSTTCTTFIDVHTGTMTIFKFEKDFEKNIEIYIFENSNLEKIFLISYYRVHNFLQFDVVFFAERAVKLVHSI